MLKIHCQNLAHLRTKYLCKKMLSCVIPLFKEPEIIIPETGKKVFPEGPCKKYMTPYKLCIIG